MLQNRDLRNKLTTVQTQINDIKNIFSLLGKELDLSENEDSGKLHPLSCVNLVEKKLEFQQCIQRIKTILSQYRSWAQSASDITLKRLNVILKDLTNEDQKLETMATSLQQCQEMAEKYLDFCRDKTMEKPFMMKDNKQKEVVNKLVQITKRLRRFNSYVDTDHDEDTMMFSTSSTNTSSVVSGSVLPPTKVTLTCPSFLIDIVILGDGSVRSVDLSLTFTSSESNTTSQNFFHTHDQHYQHALLIALQNMKFSDFERILTSMYQRYDKFDRLHDLFFNSYQFQQKMFSNAPTLQSHQVDVKRMVFAIERDLELITNHEKMTFGTNEALLHYHGLLKKTEKGRQLLFHIAPLQLLNFVDDLRVPVDESLLSCENSEVYSALVDVELGCTKNPTQLLLPTNSQIVSLNSQINPNVGHCVEFKTSLYLESDHTTTTTSENSMTLTTTTTTTATQQPVALNSAFPTAQTSQQQPTFIISSSQPPPVSLLTQLSHSSWIFFQYALHLSPPVPFFVDSLRELNTLITSSFNDSHIQTSQSSLNNLNIDLIYDDVEIGFPLLKYLLHSKPNQTFESSTKTPGISTSSKELHSVMMIDGRKYHFIHCGSIQNSLLLQRVPFRHISTLFPILQRLRQQIVYNELLSSCFHSPFRCDSPTSNAFIVTSSSFVNQNPQTILQRSKTKRKENTFTLNNTNTHFQTNSTTELIHEIENTEHNKPSSDTNIMQLYDEEVIEVLNSSSYRIDLHFTNPLTHNPLCLEVSVLSGGLISTTFHDFTSLTNNNETQQRDTSHDSRFLTENCLPCSTQYISQLLNTCHDIPLALSYLFKKKQTLLQPTNQVSK